MDSYQPDELYFRITYRDPGLTMPSIEVFRFIGRNLADEDVEDTAYFQFMDNYAEEAESQDELVPKQVATITSRDAPEMLNLDGLIKKLRAVEARIKNQN
jgi:hypothetical protein